MSRTHKFRILEKFPPPWAPPAPRVLRCSRGRDCAGLVVLTGPLFIHEIPASVLAEAERRHLPLIEQPYELPMVVVTEAIGIDNFLVPSYRYTPADKVSAKLTNSDSKTNGEDFLMVLRAIVACKAPGAVEKRLVASVFAAEGTGQALLEACGGLVDLRKEPDWSVKKA